MTTTQADQRSLLHGAAATSRGRRRLVAIATGVLALATLPMTAVAQTSEVAANDVATGLPPLPASVDNYVTTTTEATPSIDVSGFAPTCIRDAPFVSYTIVPVGFTPVDSNATLVVKTVTGTVIDTIQVTTLSGTFIWPGASVDAAGNATDWPGWTLADDGSWIPDPSDAIYREGVVIDVTVEPAPTATATVGYVPATSPCANPPSVTPPTTTTATCVPGQNGDDNPSDDCALPTTGGSPNNLVIIGAAALLAGLLVLTSARRRRDDLAPPTG